MVEILRLDHRTFRDQRITSHVGLTARALGANGFSYGGEQDPNLEESLADVAKRWGGTFQIKHVENTTNYIKNWEGIRVHLSMYGETHTKTIETLAKFQEENILIIVGGAKVPRYVYSVVDFNTAVGWQPHSEVSAVGIFLYALHGNFPLYSNFQDAEQTITGIGQKSQRSERFREL
jgi:tRNA (cytidine56-2'-O)-methyltransferase